MSYFCTSEDFTREYTFTLSIKPQNRGTCKLHVVTHAFALLHLHNAIHIYDSVVSLAFAFVTLTPNVFAFAMISTRFRAETACAILELSVSNVLSRLVWKEVCILSGVGGVVHQEEIDIADVVDEEGLVAGGSEMACLPVATVADL